MEIYPILRYALLDTIPAGCAKMEFAPIELKNLIFHLKSFRSSGYYSCMSCEYHTGKEWVTATFDITEKEIPTYVEIAIQDHVNDHVHFGRWARSFYK
jgi:hypothetical protein